MAISNDELKELFENFQWIDDIPEDQKKRDEICLEAKAALLIEANCTSERFPAFIRLAKKIGDKYKLPESVSIHCQETDNNYTPIDFDISCDSFTVKKSSENDKYWDMPTCTGQNGTEYYDCSTYGVCWNDDTCRKNAISRYSDELQNAFYAKYPSLYSICKELTPYKSVAQMCRFWGGTSDAFGKVNPRNMYPDYIWGNKTLKKNQEQEHLTDAQLEQYAFKFLIPCQHAYQDDFALTNHYYENWYCHVFPFRNQYGETIMNVIKIYDQKTQCKILLPMTTWIRNNSMQSQIFCLPYPADKMPLYNLDKLLAPECETVILCDSIELADANQRKLGSDEIVFTSFICSPGRYDQIDWSPLKNKNLFLLVSNHSGLNMDFAAVKSQSLFDYLSDFSDISLNLLTLPVKYKRLGYFHSFEDILKRFEVNKPQINKERIKILSLKREIDDFFQKAQTEIAKDVLEWMDDADTYIPEQDRILAEQKNHKNMIDYIMLPILVRGEVSMLYAKAKVGKSSLAYSIAARVVAQGYTERPKPLIEGKNWLVPYGDYKVLYLDFENMGAIKQKQEAFQDKYFPSNAATATKCKENLIMKDCSGKKYNFLDNPEELFTLLEQVRNEGTKDKDVDLLVIDTYTKFVAGVEDGKRLDKLSTLLDQLKAKQMAILFVHHANNQNGLRGNQSKTDFTNLTINMSDSNSEKTGNLDERSCIIQLELTRMQIPSVYRNEFKIKYNAETKRWQIDIGKDKIEDEDKIEIEKNENEELQSVVSYFHEKGYNREDICKMLGIGKDNFSRKGIQFKKNPKKSHN